MSVAIDPQLPAGIAFTDEVRGATLDNSDFGVTTGTTARCYGITDVYGARFDAIVGQPDLSHPTLHAGGFKPNETVTFTANGKTLGTGTSDTYGNVTATLNMPAQPSNWYPLTGSGSLADTIVGWLQSNAKTYAYVAFQTHLGNGL